MESVCTFVKTIDYSTKLGPQHYFQQYCHYPHIESRVSDRWETEIVTLYITQLSSFTTSITERLLK